MTCFEIERNLTFYKLQLQKQTKTREENSAKMII